MDRRRGRVVAPILPRSTQETQTHRIASDPRHMLNHLVQLVAGLGLWGYGILFLVVALECSAFVGLLVPGESLVAVAGVLAQQQVLDAGIAWWVAFVGAVLGDSGGYALGRFYGRPWLARHGHRAGLTEARLGKTDELFRRHGAISVLLGRFVGFARALMPFAAGAGQMRYMSFLAFDVVGAALWSLAFIALGYTLGASWGRVAHWLGRGTTLLGIALVAAAAAAWWLRRRRLRTRSP